MAKLFADSGDPDQMPPSAASDLGLHCLPSTLLWLPTTILAWSDHVTSLVDLETVFTLSIQTVGPE